jgi:hypothetical protein
MMARSIQRWIERSDRLIQRSQVWITPERIQRSLRDGEQRPFDA